MLCHVYECNLGIYSTLRGNSSSTLLLVLLLRDLTFLLCTVQQCLQYIHAVSLEDVVVQVVAILVHYLFLVHFVCM